MKIDTTKIDGYDKMTIEEKLSALESFEVEDPDYSGYVPKAQYDKTASDAANYKKQLREKMSEEEIKVKEDAEKYEAIVKERDALLREKTVAGHKAKYLALGYDEKLADDTAEAMVSGDLDKVFANQKKHLESVKKEIRAEEIKKTPLPEGGTSSETMTLNKLRGMTVAERYEYSVNHPEEYKMLYGGN